MAGRPPLRAAPCPPRVGQRAHGPRSRRLPGLYDEECPLGLLAVMKPGIPFPSMPAIAPLTLAPDLVPPVLALGFTDVSLASFDPRAPPPQTHLPFSRTDRRDLAGSRNQPFLMNRECRHARVRGGLSGPRCGACRTSGPGAGGGGSPPRAGTAQTAASDDAAAVPAGDRRADPAPPASGGSSSGGRRPGPQPERRPEYAPEPLRPRPTAGALLPLRPDDAEPAGCGTAARAVPLRHGDRRRLRRELHVEPRGARPGRDVRRAARTG